MASSNEGRSETSSLPVEVVNLDLKTLAMVVGADWLSIISALSMRGARGGHTEGVAVGNEWAEADFKEQSSMSMYPPPRCRQALVTATHRPLIETSPTDSMPEALTVIELIMINLARAGIERSVVMLGRNGREVKQVLEGSYVLVNGHMTIEFLELGERNNEFYASALLHARASFTSPFLLVASNVLLHPSMINDVANFKLSKKDIGTVLTERDVTSDVVSRLPMTGVLVQVVEDYPVLGGERVVAIARSNCQPITINATTADAAAAAATSAGSAGGGLVAQGGGASGGSGSGAADGASGGGAGSGRGGGAFGGEVEGSPSTAWNGIEVGLYLLTPEIFSALHRAKQRVDSRSVRVASSSSSSARVHSHSFSSFGSSSSSYGSRSHTSSMSSMTSALGLGGKGGRHHSQRIVTEEEVGDEDDDDDDEEAGGGGGGGGGDGVVDVADDVVKIEDEDAEEEEEEDEEDGSTVFNHFTLPEVLMPYAKLGRLRCVTVHGRPWLDFGSRLAQQVDEDGHIVRMDLVNRITNRDTADTDLFPWQRQTVKNTSRGRLNTWQAGDTSSHMKPQQSLLLPLPMEGTSMTATASSGGLSGSDRGARSSAGRAREALRTPAFSGLIVPVGFSGVRYAGPGHGKGGREGKAGAGGRTGGAAGAYDEEKADVAAGGGRKMRRAGSHGYLLPFEEERPRIRTSSPTPTPAEASELAEAAARGGGGAGGVVALSKLAPLEAAGAARRRSYSAVNMSTSNAGFYAVSIPMKEKTLRKRQSSGYLIAVPTADLKSGGMARGTSFMLALPDTTTTTSHSHAREKGSSSFSVARHHSSSLSSARLAEHLDAMREPHVHLHDGVGAVHGGAYQPTSTVTVSPTASTPKTAAAAVPYYHGASSYGKLVDHEGRAGLPYLLQLLSKLCCNCGGSGGAGEAGRMGGGVASYVPEMELHVPHLPNDIDAVAFDACVTTEGKLEMHIAVEKHVPIVGWCLLFVALCSVSMAAPMGRVMNEEVPALVPMVTALWRQSCSSMLYLPFFLSGLRSEETRQQLQDPQIILPLLVAGLGIATWGLSFYSALSFTCLANAVLFTHVTPLILVMAKLARGHSIAMSEAYGIALALTGAVICSALNHSEGSGGAAAVNPIRNIIGILLSVLASCASAGHLVLSKRIRPLCATSTYVFLNAFIPMCASTCFLSIVFWKEMVGGGALMSEHGLLGWLRGGRRLFLTQLLTSFMCDVMGNFSFYLSLRYVDPLVVAVICLMSPITAVIEALLLGVGEVPGAAVFIGGTMIIIGASLVIKNENHTSESFDVSEALKPADDDDDDDDDDDADDEVELLSESLHSTSLHSTSSNSSSSGGGGLGELYKRNGSGSFNGRGFGMGGSGGVVGGVGGDEGGSRRRLIAKSGQVIDYGGL